MQKVSLCRKWPTFFVTTRICGLFFAFLTHTYKLWSSSLRTQPYTVTFAHIYAHVRCSARTHAQTYNMRCITSTIFTCACSPFPGNPHALSSSTRRLRRSKWARALKVHASSRWLSIKTASCKEHQEVHKPLEFLSWFQMRGEHQ